eukprot:g26171.t1
MDMLSKKWEEELKWIATGRCSRAAFYHSKVMEGFISSMIKQHLLSNNLLSDAQFGFCLGHSTPDLITALVQTWTKELNSR